MAEGAKSIYDDSPWSIVNDDLSAAREFDTANEIVALADKLTTKWRTVEHNGLALEVRRSGRKKKEHTLHVRIPGRDAVASISLYDGYRGNGS